MKMEYLYGFCSGSVRFIEKEEDLKTITLGSRNCLVFYKGSNPSWNETLSQIFPESKGVNGNTYFFSNRVDLLSLNTINVEKARFMDSSVEDCTHYCSNPPVLYHFDNNYKNCKESRYSHQGYPKSLLSDQQKKLMTPMKLCTLSVGDVVKMKSEFENYTSGYNIIPERNYKITGSGYFGGYSLSCKDLNSNRPYCFPYAMLEKV